MAPRLDPKESLRLRKLVSEVQKVMSTRAISRALGESDRWVETHVVQPRRKKGTSWVLVDPKLKDAIRVVEWIKTSLENGEIPSKKPDKRWLLAASIWRLSRMQAYDLERAYIRQVPMLVLEQDVDEVAEELAKYLRAEFRLATSRATTIAKVRKFFTRIDDPRPEEMRKGKATPMDYRRGCIFELARRSPERMRQKWRSFTIRSKKTPETVIVPETLRSVIWNLEAFTSVKEWKRLKKLDKDAISRGDREPVKRKPRQRTPAARG